MNPRDRLQYALYLKRLQELYLQEKRMQKRGENTMKDNYDFNNAVIKDYSNEISDIDKLRIILDAFRATTKISKEELKKEVDALLV